MAMLPFLITAFVLVALIASGVVLNMYLYTQGAFKVRRLRTVSASQEAVAEELLSMSLGVPDRVMGDYVRRSVTILLGAITALAIVIVMVLGSYVR